MFAATLQVPGGGVVLGEAPDPVPSNDEVLVRVHATAVCRTDLQLVTGDLPARRLPVIPGHQVVGTVLDQKGGADLLGRRVGLVWLAQTCGVCRFCAGGRENLCREARFTGWDRDGGWAQLVTARSDFVHVLPDDGEDTALAPLLCGGVIGYRSLRVAQMGPDSRGRRLGLFGFGASATLVVQLARHWGIEVYVVTRSPAEVRRARELGADWAGTYDEQVPVPLDAAITFAPSGDVVISALRSVDRGGIVAVNAIHLDRIPQFDYDDLWWERSLRSVANVTRQDVREFLSWVGPAGVRTHSEVLDLAEANRALQRLAAGDVRGAFVLVPPPG